MPWNSVWPDGSKSVRANTPTGQQNTTYTETTLNNDHFWNIGANQDGRHNAINMPKQSSDPATSTGMDGTIYIKEVSGTNTRVQGFYRNVNGIYQFIPSFQSGTVDLSSSPTNYVTVANIPDNSYGNVYLFINNAGTTNPSMQFGTFKAAGGLLQAYSSDGETAQVAIILGNGANSSGLQLKAKRSGGRAGIYQYRIVYWGI